FAGGPLVEMLKTISRDALTAQFGAAVKNSSEKPSPGKRPAGEKIGPAAGGALDRFCVDITAKAAEGEIDPVFGRDREIRQMVDILARRRKNNPIVVGEAGVGKTAVVEGLALRIAEGDAPEPLRNVSILGLDMGLLQAGAGMKGEFENRLKSVINEIKASEKPMILFIDEAHVLIGAGAAAGGGDAANLLKPALARGELRTVAATTWSEYKKYFEKDAALARRFQPVKLDEPSEETTTLILRGLKTRYEDAHDVVVRDDAVKAAAELSGRYISGRQLPDKAVDLLDTSAARVKVLLTAKPDVIESKERGIQALEREKKALERDMMNGVEVDDQRLMEIDEGMAELNNKLYALKDRWIRERNVVFQLVERRKELLQLKSSEVEDREDLEEIEAGLTDEIETLTRDLKEVQGDSPLIRIEVDPDVVAKVVSDWTGIPLGKVMRDEAGTLMNLRDNLKKWIKGQDDALETITREIEAAKAGLKDPVQPLGIFLLVGPSGVGKTETGLAVADLIFGGERFMTSINMSEFQEKHTVSRLIGSPPGYVGFGEGGVLTEAVRQRPYSVVLLDEVEKADPEVMNLFYQVFDKGVLSDGEGREIDFKNTVIFLTSNLASDVVTELCAGDERPSYETVSAAIRPILSNHFKPALLARMTIAPYFTLPSDIMKEIVSLKLDKLAARMADAHKMKLVAAPEVVDQIASRCIEVETGARNIDHIMSGSVLPRMSREILARMSEGSMPSEARLGIDEEGGFSIEFG
ncbi:MAG: type VI secretion system ATPase TssH, partial [Desulfobacterales bacterium]|nr:type VI secretion system ATPase TssH [Desulfobacterales bacterium]